MELLAKYSRYTLCICLLWIGWTACNTKAGPEDIVGLWQLDDYLLEDSKEIESNILEEAKALVKDNNGNTLYFSATHTGSITPSGDTLTSMPYKLEKNKLIIVDVAESQFELKDKNTLHIFEEHSGLIVQFKRKK